MKVKVIKYLNKYDQFDCHGGYPCKHIIKYTIIFFIKYNQFDVL